MSALSPTSAASAAMPGVPSGPVIGVFDSGFGGLTVLRALLSRVPGAHFVYVGDTARLPYGAKSQATVARYAVEAAQFLVARGAELLVIACNTATALALPQIRAAVGVPVVGVVEPGATAALAAASSRRSAPEAGKAAPEVGKAAPEVERSAPAVLVLATAATVQSHAYRDTCAALGLRVAEMACPLLVPLVEEGWTDHPVTREVLRLYLAQALETACAVTGCPAAVLLGCTHYPLIAPAIQATLRALGSSAPVVDSAEATADEVRHLLTHRLANSASGTEPPPASFECFATDSVEKFARLGSQFLGRPIPHVELLDLGG